MTLAEWLDRNFWTNRMFAHAMAKELKRRRFSHRTVEGWRQKRCKPRLDMMPHIRKITRNDVTPVDFYEG
jgi:hypothetical protein